MSDRDPKQSQKERLDTEFVHRMGGEAATGANAAYGNMVGNHGAKIVPVDPAEDRADEVQA